MTASMQLRIEIDDWLVDPAFGMAWPGLGAGAHGLGEGGVGGDIEFAGAHRAGKPLGQVKTIERKHGPQSGVKPMQLGVVAPLAHGKNADAVGLQQEVGRDLQHGGGYFLRPTSFSSQWMS